MTGTITEPIKKELRNNVLITDFQIWKWDKTHQNFLCIVTRGEDKEYKYQYLDKCDKHDEYFDVTEVKEGDVLVAGTYEYKQFGTKKYRQFPEKVFYGVVYKDDECMLLVRDTTYLKVKKLIDKHF